MASSNGLRVLKLMFKKRLSQLNGLSPRKLHNIHPLKKNKHNNLLSHNRTMRVQTKGKLRSKYIIQQDNNSFLHSKHLIETTMLLSKHLGLQLIQLSLRLKNASHPLESKLLRKKKSL